MERERRGSTDRGSGQVFVEFQLAGGDDGAVPHPLRDITDLELEEIRQLKHPPETVSRVMECVHLILGGEGPAKRSAGIDWHSVLKTVVRANFLRQVRRYSLEDMRTQPALVDFLCREYLAGPKALRPERVRRASRAVVAFFGWTVSLIAGVLPEWPEEEVGGREAREAVLMLEAERLASARRADAERKARLKDAKEEEGAEGAEAERRKAEEEEEAERRRAEEEKAEAERRRAGEDEEEAKRREAERLEAEKLEEERCRARKEDEAQAAQEAKRMEEQRRLEKRVAEAQQEKEEEDMEIFSPSMVMWDSAGNPERKFLQVDGVVVHFPSADFVSCCNVMTREPVRRGMHFFEFVLHGLGGEQWCGVTTDSTQAGMRVSGWNLKGWSYYCGNRGATSSGLPALHVNKKVVQPFDHVNEGDVVGLLLDADRRGLAFLRNGGLQGVCELIPRNRSPLFLLTHVGAGGDRVELRRHRPEQAPQSASVALNALLCKVTPVQ